MKTTSKATTSPKAAKAPSSSQYHWGTTRLVPDWVGAIVGVVVGDAIGVEKGVRMGDSVEVGCSVDCGEGEDTVFEL